jgi:TonB-linked SusC/RagA family outer membrane protein
MKKFEIERGCVWFKPAFKTLLTMKLIFLLVCGVGLLTSVAEKSYAQSTKLTFSLKDASIKNVLEHIENSSEFSFMYENNVIDVDAKVDFTANDETIDVILNRLLNDYIEYRVIGRHIVLFPSGPVPGETLPAKSQQQPTVSGTVSDESGQPLPGVTVLVKGTTRGTVTNADGNYSLTNIPEDATLVFSFVGMRTQEIEVGNQTSINVTMAVDAIGIEEVVAVGYGSIKKRDLTGAISSVKAEDIQKIPVANIDQALTGQAAGVQVVSNSGEPGGGASIRIRGIGTVNNAEPLFVIDGIPIDNSFNRSQTTLTSINSADIESIEILKDASALAIYGARAANGVVLITTKRGQAGQLLFELDAWTSVNVLDQNIEMLNGKEWASYYQDALNSIGNTIDQNSQSWLNAINNGSINPPTFDWLGEAIRPAITQSYQIGASGGNERSVFALSGNYLNQEGVFKNNDLKRYSFRINSDHKISEIFKFGNTLTFSRIETQTHGAGDPTGNDAPHIRSIMGQNSFKPIFNSEGDYADLNDFDAIILDHSPVHPIWALQERSRLRFENRLLGSLFGEYKIINGLTFKSIFSIDLRQNELYEHSPWNELEGNANNPVGRSSVYRNNQESLVWYLDNTLTYQKSIGSHSFTALLGNQAQEGTYRGFNVSGNTIPNNDFPFIRFTTTELINGGDYENSNSWLSYFGRIFYDYNSKYLITATVRRDGSSRFGPGKRYGTFPAASIGWRVSEESFMENINIDNLKIRASYGITGSENAGNYQFIGTVGTGVVYDYIFGPDLTVQGRTIRRLPNDLLQWEETKQANFGLDLGLINNRLTFSADYFNRITDKMFLEFQPPVEAGIEENTSGNLGQITNSGFEFVLNTVNSVKTLDWTTSINLTMLKNRVDELANDNAPRYTLGAWGSGTTNITEVGGEIGALFGYVTDGLFQNWNDVYAHAYQNQAVTGTHDDKGNPIYDTDSRNTINFTAPGDVRFADLNNDGIINDDDRTVIGSTIPDFLWGLTNTLSYQGLHLSFFFQGAHGVDIFNHLRRLQEGMNATNADNMRATVKNRWTAEGTSNKMPRLNVNDPNNNTRNSDLWVEDGSYVRLKNLRLAYDLPKSLMNSAGMQNLQLYFNATNLLTFSDYQGFDPEIGNRNPTRSETAGTDNGNYPLTKQFTFGLKATF